MLNFHLQAIKGQLIPNGWIKLFAPDLSSGSLSNKPSKQILRPKLVWESSLEHQNEGEVEGNIRQDGPRSLYLPFNNGESCRIDENDGTVLLIRRTVSSKRRNSKTSKQQTNSKNQHKRAPSDTEGSNNNHEPGSSSSIIVKEERFSFESNEKAREFYDAVQIAFPCRIIFNTEICKGKDSFLGLDEPKRTLFWWTEVQTENEEENDQAICEVKGELQLELVTRVMRTDDNFIRVSGKENKELLTFELNKDFDSKSHKIQALDQYVSFLNSLVAASSGNSYMSDGDAKKSLNLSEVEPTGQVQSDTIHEQDDRESDGISNDDNKVEKTRLPWVLRLFIMCIPFLVKTFYLFVTDATAVQETARTVGEENYQSVATGLSITSSLFEDTISEAVLPLFPSKLRRNPTISLTMIASLILSILSIFWRFVFPRSIKDSISFLVSIIFKLLWILLLSEGLLLLYSNGFRGRILVTSSAIAFLCGVIADDDHLGLRRILRIFGRSILPLQIAIHVWHGDFLSRFYHVFDWLIHELVTKLSASKNVDIQDARETMLKCISIGWIIYGAPNALRVLNFYLAPIYGPDSILNHPSVFRYLAFGVLFAVYVDAYPEVVPLLSVLASMISPRLVSSLGIGVSHFVIQKQQQCLRGSNVFGLLAAVGLYIWSLISSSTLTVEFLDSFHVLQSNENHRDLIFALFSGTIACWLIRLFYLPGLGRFPSVVWASWLWVQTILEILMEGKSKSMDYHQVQSMFQKFIISTSLNLFKLLKPQCVDQPLKEVNLMKSAKEFIINEEIVVRSLICPLVFLVLNNSDWIVWTKGPRLIANSSLKLVSLASSLRILGDAFTCLNFGEPYLLFRTVIMGRVLFTLATNRSFSNQPSNWTSTFIILYLVAIACAFQSQLLLVVSPSLFLLHNFIRNRSRTKRMKIIVSSVVITILFGLSHFLVKAGVLNIPAGLVWVICGGFELGHGLIGYFSNRKSAQTSIAPQQTNKFLLKRTIIMLKLSQVVFVVLPFVILTFREFAQQLPYMKISIAKMDFSNFILNCGFLLASYAVLISSLDIKLLATDFGISRVMAGAFHALEWLDGTRLALLAVICSSAGLFGIYHFEERIQKWLAGVDHEWLNETAHKLMHESNKMPKDLAFSWVVYLVHLVLLQWIPVSWKGIVRPRTILVPVGSLFFFPESSRNSSFWSIYFACGYLMVSFIIGIVEFYSLKGAMDEAHNFARFKPSKGSKPACPTCNQLLEFSRDTSDANEAVTEEQQPPAQRIMTLKRVVETMPLCGHSFHEPCVVEFGYDRCPICMAPTQLWWSLLTSVI